MSYVVSSSDTFFLGEGAVLIVSFRSLDGRCLIASARDGYCTLVTFGGTLPAHRVHQHTIQLQSIAMMIPLASGTPGLPASQMPPVVVQDQCRWTPKSRKRDEPPLRLAASVDGGRGGGEYFSTGDRKGDGDAVGGAGACEEKEQGCLDEGRRSGVWSQVFMRSFISSFFLFIPPCFTPVFNLDRSIYTSVFLFYFLEGKSFGKLIIFPTYFVHV